MIWYNDRRKSLIMRSLYEIDIPAEIRSINKKNGRMSEYAHGGLYRDLKNHGTIFYQTDGEKTSRISILQKAPLCRTEYDV